jgi:hypothetical protein
MMVETGKVRAMLVEGALVDEEDIDRSLLRETACAAGGKQNWQRIVSS